VEPPKVIEPNLDNPDHTIIMRNRVEARDWRGTMRVRRWRVKTSLVTP